MRRVAGIAIVAASLGCVLAAALAWFGLPPHAAATVSLPVWTEVAWPFPIDQWGKGKAFRCKAADCGAEVNLYLRAKIGFCNCTTGVADDEDLDRMGDLVLVGDVSPLGRRSSDQHRVDERSQPRLPAQCAQSGQKNGDIGRFQRTLRHDRSNRRARPRQAHRLRGQRDRFSQWQYRDALGRDYAGSLMRPLTLPGSVVYAPLRLADAVRCS